MANGVLGSIASLAGRTKRLATTCRWRRYSNSKQLEFNGLTINATALYALSAPGVPEEARDEAVKRAQAGLVTA
jgi:hypothetical protein